LGVASFSLSGVIIVLGVTFGVTLGASCWLVLLDIACYFYWNNTSTWRNAWLDRVNLGLCGHLFF
jgi:hypothetical protein